MANREQRTVLLFKGNGSPLISRKQERNKQCDCNSGKKAKHCCGTESVLSHTLKTELVKPKPKTPTK